MKKTTIIIFISFLFLFLIFIGLLISETFLLPTIYFSMGKSRAIELREYGPGLIWKKNKKIIVEMDDKGFVKPSGVYENPDHSIVFLGGSTTLCKAVDIDKRFPSLVGKQMSEITGKKINSYNGGVEGNTTLNTINIFLNKVVPMQPDIVVIHHNINGIGKRKIIESDMLYFLNYLLDRFSNLFPVTYSRIKAIIQKGQNMTLNKPEEEMIYNYDVYEGHLRAFISLARAYHITPVLMTQASNYTPLIKRLEMKKEWEQTHRTNNQIVRELGKELNVTVIELAKNFSSREFLYDDLHYGNEGSVAASNLITSHLVPLLKDKPLFSNK